MSNSSLTTQERALEIRHDAVNGPLNLEETILSAQTSEPEWVREQDSFTDVEELSGIPVKYTVTQTGHVDNFTVNVRAVGSTIDDHVIAALRSHLDYVLGFRDDLLLFYRTFDSENEPLLATFSKLRGLRLMRGTNFYESLICSILSQNNSARLWNRTARLMMRYYGRRVDFPDGTEYFLFPQPEALSKLKPRQLQATTSMGYRAKPVVQISRMIVRGKLRLTDLERMDYDEALEFLLELPGVGPKVADCFLLYGLGKLEAAPVDVWIHKIVSRLYFSRRKITRPNTARFLRERFGKWAGYAQLYLFDYARRMMSGLKSK